MLKNIKYSGKIKTEDKAIMFYGTNHGINNAKTFWIRLKASGVYLKILQG